MTIRKLETSEWSAFLSGLSKLLEGKQAEIEVASLAWGAQIEAEWLPLLGLAYDPKNDQIEVILDGIDQMISHPRELLVDDSVGGLMGIEILDASGTTQIIKLRDPLMLPAPAH
jgi:hypothetical protein